MKTALLAASLCLLFSCSKEYSYEKRITSELTRANFHAFLTSPGTKFQPVDFYSDQPIDFDKNDGSTELETDLQKYVSSYLPDDHYNFLQDGKIVVEQNELRKQSIVADNFERSYAVSESEQAVLFDFLDHNYNPKRYILHEIGSDYFILKVAFENAMLYSRYNLVR